MKKIHLLFLVFILLTSGIRAQNTGANKYLKPAGFQHRITVLVSGKTRYYYQLDHLNASVITLKGPGKLQVITRGQFKPGAPDKMSYNVVYTIDGGDQKKKSATEITRSTNDTYQNGSLGVPGKSSEFEIELGRGDHSIEFKLGTNTFPIAARYIFTPTKEKKQEWIAFSPLQPSEPVDLISKETTVSYYRFSKLKPLKTQINGPTELRIFTRLENHYQMRGRIHYRIQVKENEKVINTYQLSSEHSEVAVYEEDQYLIPGKACEFVITVPEGKHTYTILPLDEDKNTVLGRLLIPKKDVKLVE
jgi:hypothetical protein